ncbi:23S rRNA (uracil(1939)-C(5))-methyltransferase RlmD [Domibacillus epiphyticus]|uniref:23S rRNA (Uracil-5-)-methyltransferase RumA n=1 Tax=Domibacillus epiphyticus TaxID=1714355 RepID=A0A1V2AAK6_9BACI|nr:23S rRNA (uracil(1939)-C(5))-methyltransferase RlmD [Domibacillus epiphyticus]OMP68036.1 23S rRNA (uracil-5-)-methyltransferase RumA [Domibacillus epiphyticus]
MAKIQAPVKMKDVLHVTFTDLTHEGKAVAKVDGYPLFVEGALPDETGEIEVTKLNKGYGFAKLVRLDKTVPERQEPPCRVYDECGGCQLQHMTYEGQLNMKYNQVRNVMNRIAKMPDVPVHPVLGMEDSWRYRNKAQVPVGLSGGSIVAGFYKKRSHEIIDMNECLIQHEQSDEIIQKVKDVCAANGVMPYDEKRHKGVIRHVMARIGYQTGEKMAVLITRTADLPNKEAIIKGIRDAVPGITSIVQNVNPDKTNVIFGNQTRTLYGEDVIYDTIGDVKFAISARSFYQVNPVQTEVLYGKALEYAELTGNEVVIDAYCGIGTISLFLAKKAKEVYGVEIVPQAIEDAKKNAELNGIKNAAFEAGKAEEVIPAWHKQGIRPDVIVVDPPRKGCDEALLQTILDMKPKRVVYVSCNPGTLARDLRTLEDGGYKTREVQPVDMFPQTVHVEAVAVLTLY